MSGKPPIHAQAHKHGARRCDGGPPSPHAKDALALPYNGLLCSQLRVSRNVCECAEADKGCAACVKRQSLSLRCHAHCWCWTLSVPTTRQGVQSSNCALSCFRASLKVGVATSFAMAVVRWSMGESRDHVGGTSRQTDAGILHHCSSRPPRPNARQRTPRLLEPHVLVSAWRAGDTARTMSTIEALFIFDEHK